MTRLPPINLDPVMLAARVARALSQTHRLAFAQLGPELTVVQHSPNFLALLEHSEWKVTGKPVSEVLWEFVGLEESLIEVLQGKRPEFQLDYVNRVQADGSINYLNFQVTPLEVHQPERGLLLLVEDVTDYGRLQQALTQERNDLLLLQSKLAQANEELFRINQLKSLFLSMAAHDLRSPLSVINGYADLLQRLIPKDDPSNLHKYLVTIESQSKRMNRLVNDLLDLDSLEREELELNVRETDLVELIREVVEIEKINFTNREIELRLPHTAINLHVDSEKISRVVHNLVSNACKYTPENGYICIMVASIDDEAVFQILDNGQGMSQEQLSHLFQPYYRTKDAKESKVEGRGLGLYIVKMLVEAHDGQVEVESSLGEGSTFTVHLPIQQNSGE